MNRIKEYREKHKEERKVYLKDWRKKHKKETKEYRKKHEEKIKAYTTVGGAPHLDGDYTVFGKVISGLDVIDKIARVQKGSNDRPIEDIRMVITVEEMPRKEIESKYGYKFPAKQ